MNRETLGKAIDEAVRFLDRARPLYAAMKHDENMRSDYEDGQRTTIDDKATPTLRGAAKRASMDLTRALAEMRRPG